MPKAFTSVFPSLVAAALAGAAGWYGGGMSGPRAGEGERLVVTARAAQIQAVSQRWGNDDGWMQRVKAAAAQDFPSLMAEVAWRFPDRHSRDMARQWLLGLWVSRDADGAIAYAKANPQEALEHTLGQLIGTLLPERTELLLASQPLGYPATEAAYATVARLYPRLCLERAKRPHDCVMRWSPFVAEAIASLARMDPAAAAQEMASLPAGADGDSAATQLTHAWFKQDAAAARRWIDSLRPGTIRDLAAHTWLGALAAKDARAAWRELEGFGFAPLKALSIGSGDSFSEAAYANDARNVILQNLARESPGEAMAALSTLLAAGVNGESRSSLEMAVAAGLINALPREPAAFLAAAGKLIGQAGLPPWAPDDEFEISLSLLLIPHASREWSTEQKLEALPLIAADDKERPDVTAANLRQLMESIAEADPQRAAQSFTGLPDNAKAMVKGELLRVLRGEALQQVVDAMPAESWSAYDGRELASDAGANAAVVAALPDNAATSGVRHEFAAGWAATDPDAAASWVVAQPPSPGTGESARGLAGAWAGYDDAAASAWADTLPAGPAREGAAAGLVPVLAERDPEAAWQWAGEISDAAARAGAMLETANAWREAPPEFRAALVESLSHAGRSQAEIAAEIQRLDTPATEDGKGGSP